MAILVIKCPHCLVDGVAAQIIGARIYMGGLQRKLEELWASVAATCPRCSKPVAAILTPGQGLPQSFADFDQAMGAFLGSDRDAEVRKLYIDKLWPEPPNPEIPNHVPQAVERAMLQAERNFPVAGNEEAAAM